VHMSWQQQRQHPSCWGPKGKHGGLRVAYSEPSDGSFCIYRVLCVLCRGNAEQEESRAPAVFSLLTAVLQGSPTNRQAFAQLQG
jgi:hypothetical protein